MKEAAKQLFGVGLTTARLGIAEYMAQRVRDDKPIDASMTAFVVSDVADGAILRKFDADTRTRRVADGVIDHLSEVRVAAEVAKKYPETRIYIGILAARAAIVGGMNLFHLLKTGEATKGRKWQRATSLATAAFALTAVRGNEKATKIAGSVAAGVAIGTGIVHLKGIGRRHNGVTREL